MENLNLINWFLKHVPLNAIVGTGFLFLVGCAGSHMVDVPDSKLRSTPKPTEAMVTFIRPTSMYASFSSSVFDITDGTPKLIGILARWKKIGYPVKPGKYRFMVAARGRAAGFISADLARGKSYYVRVTPSFWAGEFSLEPYRRAELDTSSFSDDFKNATWVAKTPDAEKWAVNNATSIREKLSRLPEWLQKADRQSLRPEDGK